MKKISTIFLMFIYTIVIVACGHQNVSQDAMSANEDIETSSSQNKENIWREQDVMNMYYGMTNGETGLEYLDCVLMPDYAGGRIGAVLFADTEEGTTNIAFFNAEGYAQQCGVYAKAADIPDLIYLGEGEVTFKLETDEHIVYNCNISIAVDDSDVEFVITDDLQK